MMLSSFVQETFSSKQKDTDVSKTQSQFSLFYDEHLKDAVIVGMK